MRRLPKFDPSVTQEVVQALFDSGHDDLAESIGRGAIYRLEAQLEELRRELAALKESHAKKVTETGVNRIIDLREGANLKEWSVWAFRRVLPWALATLIGAAYLLREHH